MRLARRPLLPLVVWPLLVVAGACGAAGDEPIGAPVGAPVPAQAETTTTAVPATTLPGDPLDPIYTPAGAELGAVAIPFDETLDVRSLPGETEAIVASLPPLATGIVSTGRAQSLGVGRAWLEVSAGGATGWAPMGNLRYVGGTRDVTARIVAGLGGTPTARTMLELGQLVADSVASDDPEVTSRVVAVVAPTEGATGAVTYDVADFPDDSVAGERLAVVGRQVPGDLPGTAFASVLVYELVRVESTVLCYRGVTPDGLCT